MKKILITGAGSYVGTSVEAWLKQWPESYRVAVLDMIGDGWKDHDFRCRPPPHLRTSGPR